MKHRRMEMWVDEKTGGINVVSTEPLFGELPDMTVPLWDDVEQRLMLNNGETRIEVVVYNNRLSLEVIKHTVRLLLPECAKEW